MTDEWDYEAELEQLWAAYRELADVYAQPSRELSREGTIRNLRKATDLYHAVLDRHRSQTLLREVVAQVLCDAAEDALLELDDSVWQQPG